MSDCLVHGCVSRGKHVPDCGDHCRHWPGECPQPRRDKPACDGHCSGCLPRPADDGIAVCRWHANRFQDAVVSTRALIPHLREIGKPYAESPAPSGETFSPGDPAERTVLPAACLAADELDNDLNAWIEFTCEDRGFDRVLTDDGTATWVKADGPSHITWPNGHPWNGDLSWWALDHQTAMLSGEWAGDMVRHFTELVEAVRRRWPTADDREPLELLAMPCPRCDTRSLIRRPPLYAGHPRLIECTDQDCSRIFTEDEYDTLVALALRDGRAGKWRTA